MSVVGLFSGIGGLELGFQRSGFKTSLLVEIDPAAIAVLQSRFPSADLFVEGVQKLSELPEGAEIVTSGFPCQNLSMAGDKSGISGAKSGIVGEMFRLIADSEVQTVVVENVPFMLRLDSGKAMAWLVDQFERLDFQWAYRILDSQAFGVPQRRRRVYLVACRKLDPRRILFADDTLSLIDKKARTLDQPLGFYWTEGRSGVGFTVDGVPPLKVGSGLGIPSAPAVLFPDGEVLMPSVSAGELLQGFPSGWTEKADAVKVRSRWRLIGNAVTVPVASWIASRVKTPGEPLAFEERPIRDGSAWPNSARSSCEGPLEIKAGDSPILVKAPSIATFRDSSWSRLSDRALKGFYSRAEAGNLRMPEGFLEAVSNAPRK